jgi:DHA2 family multidrug resistance protein
VAEAKAKANLDQAPLNLRYCAVVAEIDGVVTRRSVNPGDHVLARTEHDGAALADRHRYLGLPTPAPAEMTVAAGAMPVARRTISPWLGAVVVVIPTFMEVLDTTIANVALRYIAGGMSAPATDSEWVMTGHLAANAMVLSISGWLAPRLGRRNDFLFSIAMFTIASALCGMATSLLVLIGARVLQGLAGGGLRPSSQAVRLDAFPREKQGAAMTIFGMAALLAPVVGPTLGGFTDNYGWRWIFYLNVPVGVIAAALPRSGRGSRLSRRRPFDALGLGLLSVTMVCWEVVLSKRR